ncbi:MAG: hypothetical protein ACOVOF_01475 [Chryseotalea sp.]|jgi:hypothetical protein|nr:hypothetical protein [Flammeovirgaceae bacterium]
MKKYIVTLVLAAGLVLSTQAQNNQDDRMERDLKVAENVLSTLIKQEQKLQGWMPVDVTAIYRSGYGVTFFIPDYSHYPKAFVVRGKGRLGQLKSLNSGDGFSYSIETDEDGEVISETIEGDVDIEEEIEKNEREDKERSRTLKEDKEPVEITRIATSDELSKQTITAVKTFLADYAGIISQLKDNERIIVTNKRNEGNNYFRIWDDTKRTYLSIEVSQADVKQYQSGKLNRDQFINKIKVIESEISKEKSQDLDLITTIFDRLYQPDLSKTFFTEGDIYYERLSDYGVIYYMTVYSSNQMNQNMYYMPTLKLDKLTAEERNKKVAELYPKFEQELKENVLEYGRTVKSLKPNEVLSFQVNVTKCKGCGIPSTVEINTKASVLTDYLLGKIDKNAALKQLEVKKGNAQ